METVGSSIHHIAQAYAMHSSSACLDAELLVAHTVGHERTWLWAHSDRLLTVEQQHALWLKAKRRLAGEPMAYILGRQAFWSLCLEVTPAVLIPRPETELLVEWVLARFSKEQSLDIVDLGTGSGAIALALAEERPHWQIEATDLSAEALTIARRNADIYTYRNLHFYQSDWCRGLQRSHYDVIISNPPYIQESDAHLKDLRYEPTSALVGGESGLVALEKIVSHAYGHLNPSGYLVLEHGYDQAPALELLMKETGYVSVEDYVDLAGHPRMMVGCRP